MGNVQHVALGIFEQTFDPLCTWADETVASFVHDLGHAQGNAEAELGMTMAFVAGLQLGQAAGMKEPRVAASLVVDMLREFQRISGKDLSIDKIDWEQVGR